MAQLAAGDAVKPRSYDRTLDGAIDVLAAPPAAPSGPKVPLGLICCAAGERKPSATLA
ncbi:hypothetical protein D3C72_1934490 [compost metagenome]